MRFVDALLTWAGAQSVSMGATSHSDPILLDQLIALDVQIEWTSGSPVGNFTIETSNDQGQYTSGGVPTGITNWTTYSGSTQAAGGTTGTFAWHFTSLPPKWMRLTYTRSSDTGTLVGRIAGKGW